MSEAKSSTSLANSLITFFALYLTTLFSLDTWGAARDSPYRSSISGEIYRPSYSQPSSYQMGMHGRGNAGPRGDGGARPRNVGRLDNRAPLKMGVTSKCGGCMQ